MSALLLHEARYAVALLWPPGLSRVRLREEKEPVARESQGDRSCGLDSKEGFWRRLVGVQEFEMGRAVVVVVVRRRVGRRSMVGGLECVDVSC